MNPPEESESNAGNWHDERHRFAKGNPGGPGNPYIRRLAEHRQALAEAITADDLRAVLKKLLKLALAGEAWAISEVLNRCLGRPPLPVELAGDAIDYRNVAFTLNLGRRLADDGDDVDALDVNQPGDERPKLP
jgi:hypothetical protein